jgi:hypothetical protein
MTARDIRIWIKKGAMVLDPGSPPPPDEISDFQKRRIRRACMYADLYFRKKQTIDQIGEAIGAVSHQWVSQMLKVAVKFLTDTGWLHAPEKVKARKRRKAS